VRTPTILSLLAACAGEPDDDDTAAAGARTLDTCATDVEDGVPEFYARYFRCVTVTATAEEVTIATTALPPHPSPYYDEDDPNWEEFDSRGGDYQQNPNVLSTQDLSMTVDIAPISRGIEVTSDLVDEQAGTSGFEYGGGAGALGVALDGVALFHGVAAPGDDIADEQYTFDTWEGHPQNTGQYHHHSANPAGLAVLAAAGLVTVTVPGQAEIELYGMMCDGTLVLGCTELDGAAPDTADFDAQAGHAHDIADDQGTTHFSARYHTHMCTAQHEHGYTPEIQYYEGCGR
jgi:hypothetical protein